MDSSGEPRQNYFVRQGKTWELKSTGDKRGDIDNSHPYEATRPKTKKKQKKILCWEPSEQRDNLFHAKVATQQAGKKSGKTKNEKQKSKKSSKKKNRATKIHAGI